MQLLKSIFLASRPKTLPAGLVPVLVGAILSWRVTGRYDVSLLIFTILSAVFIQIGCNFFNDAIDYKKGADTKERIGPRRVTASGLLSVKQVYGLAIFALLISVACSIPLFEAVGWPLLFIGIPSLYLSYGYTGGPYPLAYKGLAEIFVVLFFGLIAVCGSAWIQSGLLLPVSIPVGLQCGLISAVLVSVNNIRDRKEDAKVGKKTFAVRFGDLKARKFAIGMMFATWALLYKTLVLLNDFDFLWLWSFPIALALFIVWKLYKMPATARFNSLLALVSVDLLLYAAVLHLVVIL